MILSDPHHDRSPFPESLQRSHKLTLFYVQADYGSRRPVRESDVQRGLLQTIPMPEDKAIKGFIMGLTFLPQLQHVCVVYQLIGEIWLFPLDDSRKGRCFPLRTTWPMGLTSLKTKPNTVVVARHEEKLLHVVTFAKKTGSENIDVAGQMLWRLRFRPANISSFKTDLLLVLDGEELVVWIFTEGGNKQGSIRIQIENPETMFSFACIGTAKGLWVALNNEETKNIIHIVRVNQQGKITLRYADVNQIGRAHV